MARGSEVNLGDRVKCRVTGFKGIVTSFTTWLNGCVRIGVQPEELKDGTVQGALNFDVEQIDVVKKAVHPPTIVIEAPAPLPKDGTTGGPPREGKNFKRF